MDHAAFSSLLTSLSPKEATPSEAAAQPAPEQGAQTVGQEGDMFPQADAPSAAAPATPPAPATLPDGTGNHSSPQDPTAGGMFPSGGQFAKPNPGDEQGAHGLSDPSAPIVEAPVSGMLKGVYETKDFAQGHETPKEERSALRRAVDQGPNAANAGLGYSLSEGVGQFGIGMLGAGKFVKAAEMVPSVGRGVAALRASKVGTAALTSGEGAAAQAIAFDPHAERMSNLVQEYPGLQRPIVQYLAAKPGDTEAEGRLKNAIEGLGLGGLGEAAGIGAGALSKTLIGGLRKYRAMAQGNPAEAAAADAELQAALAKSPQEAPQGATQPVPASGGTPGAPAAVDAASGAPSGLGVDPASSAQSQMVTAHVVDEGATPTGGQTFRPADLQRGLGGIDFERGADGSARITGAELPDSMRGQGKGTDMYRAFADQMHAQGVDVKSDLAVSPQAAKVYQKLQAEGYNVQQNPNVHTYSDGGMTSTDGQPVFTVQRPGGDTHVDLNGTEFAQRDPNGPYEYTGTQGAAARPTMEAQAKLSDSLMKWVDLKGRFLGRDSQVIDRSVEPPMGLPGEDAAAQAPSGTFRDVPTIRSSTIQDLMLDHPGTAGVSRTTLPPQLKFLKDAGVGDVKVHVVSDPDAQIAYRRAGGDLPEHQHVDGFYDGTEHAIVMKASVMQDPYRGPLVLVHEAWHAALFNKLNVDHEMYRHIEDLIGHVKANTPDTHYGLTDPHEFISEAMANDHFQLALSRIKAPAVTGASYGPTTTAWQAFVKIVKKAFGVRDETMLDAALRLPEIIQARALERDRAAMAQGGGGAEGPAAMASPEGGPPRGPIEGDPGAANTPGGPEVSRVKNATEAAGGDRAAIRHWLQGPHGIDLTDAQVESIFRGTQSDMDAFTKWGSWEEAQDNGHIFGKGGNLPYQKMADDAQLQAFVERNAEALKEELDKAKGGDVLSDAYVKKFVAQRVKLFGEDPAALMGLITRAGKDANGLVANMETAYVISQRGYQDGFVLANKIAVGALDEFGGSHEAAMAQLKQILTVANSSWGAAQSMRAAVGRGMRRMRAEFRPDPEMVAALGNIGDKHLVEMLRTSGGDPRLLKKAMTPSLMSRITDGFQFSYVNGLLWGLRSHWVNAATNAYMLTARPMERILGSLGVSAVNRGVGEAADDALRIRRESAKQYYFMAASARDAWKSAVEAWRLGDSILSPHEEEAFGAATGAAMQQRTGQSLGTYIAQLPFKKVESMADVLHNTFLVAAPKAIGLPTRTLGAADELVKQVVYRSQVQARAFVEGQTMGLVGDDLALHVKNRLYAAFDDAGRAIDASALREAEVSTFQQQLNPGTLGAGVQHMTANTPQLRIILPFVKTPTNVLRTGWKMTPILNMAQQEFRQEFSGALGAERQAQAMGQMGMGILFFGTATALAYEGYITGDGPSDPKDRAALLSTGWQPASFAVPGPDGKLHYVNYGRYDPIAMPFGIAANIVNAFQVNRDDQGVAAALEQAALGAVIGVTKNITSKTYLKSLDDTIQALQDPDRNATKWLGTLGANAVPFSSALRFMNQTTVDPVMRDSRSFTDYILAELPGGSLSMRPKRDAFGDAQHVHPGLWVNSDNDMVNAEMRRLAEKPGASETIGPPSAKYEGGVDLRDIKMKDGRDAYDVFQQLARQPSPNLKPIKDVVANVMKGRAYQMSPDGDSRTKGTKMYLLTDVMSKYRRAATNLMKMDPNVRAAAQKKMREAMSQRVSLAKDMNPTAANMKASTLDALTRMATPRPSQPQQ